MSFNIIGITVSEKNNKTDNYSPFKGSTNCGSSIRDTKRSYFCCKNIFHWYTYFKIIMHTQVVW